MADEITTQLPEVAKNVLIACKKCGVERYHKVLFHVNSTTAKVECEVCKSKKTFKVGSNKKTSETKKKSSKKESSTVTAVSVWSELKEKIGSDKASSYSMTSKYENNTSLDHPKFGLGFITNATYNRIEVQFQDALRTLVHNQQK